MVSDDPCTEAWGGATLVTSGGDLWRMTPTLEQRPAGFGPKNGTRQTDGVQLQSVVLSDGGVGLDARSCASPCCWSVLPDIFGTFDLRH